MSGVDFLNSDSGLFLLILIIVGYVGGIIINYRIKCLENEMKTAREIATGYPPVSQETK